MRRRFLQKLVYNENIVITSKLNPKLQNILYSNGLVKNKNYTTKDELAAINDELFKTAFSGNTTLTDLLALLYFTGITTIPENCFKSNSALCYVRLPKNIISIGNNAFYGCTSLRKVLNFSNLNITINGTEFGYIGNNVEVLLNNPIVEDDYIFKFENDTYILYDYLGNQSDLELPKNYKGNPYIIGNRAFYSNLNITSIIIPEGVTSIKNRAFSTCSNLIHILIPDSVNEIDAGCFYSCYKLTSITIPNNITGIKEYTFNSCSGLTSIKISSNITSIENYAFSSCTGLTSVHIEDLTAWCKIKFGYSANPLLHAHNLYLNGELVTNFETPNEISKINMYTFLGCGTLTSINIHNNITSIGDYAFDECTGLTSVEIPNSVASIGRSAFYGCRGLTFVEIGNGVTGIGNYAFCGCRGLTSITIPNKVTRLGEWAFYNCFGLTSITCKAINKPTIYSNTFNGVNKSIPLYVPAESIEAYKTTNYWKQFTNIQAINN